jgi:beta-phosphoglucomutase-like phosphatase (HAD superfamily)
MFPVLVTSEDVARGKPAPDTYRLALERSGSTAEQTLVVEDSIAGLEAAAAAGTWSAAVRTHCQFADPRFLGNYPDLRALLMAIFVPIQ